MEEKKHNTFSPLVLIFLIVFADQITKALVVKYIPEGDIAFKYWNDFLWICHVRNTGAAFSFGDSFSPQFRLVLFVVLPVLLIGFLTFLSISGKSPFNGFQRWVAAGIAGGGLGTIIDRIFRFNEGVVDFISVKFYGLLGMDRWPTFNVSDSCVVVFVILFALSIVFQRKKSYITQSEDSECKYEDCNDCKFDSLKKNEDLNNEDLNDEDYE